eukprot:2731062-Amphidinium_carterae.1
MWPSATLSSLFKRHVPFSKPFCIMIALCVSFEFLCVIPSLLVVRQQDHEYDMHTEIRPSNCRFTSEQCTTLQSQFSSSPPSPKEVTHHFEQRLQGVQCLSSSTVMEMELIRTTPLGGKLSELSP